MRLRRVAPFAVAALVAGTIVATITLAAPATTVEDRNDTRGVLDVETVRFTHPKGQPPKWQIVTFDGWRAATLWDRGYLYVLIDTLGGEPAEYAAQVRSDGRRMRGVLYRLGKGERGRDVAIAALDVGRANRSSVSVRVLLKRMRFGEKRTYYRWWVVTTLSGDRCASLCIDRAPNRNSVRQFRPGMSPSPSPSPTESG